MTPQELLDKVDGALYEWESTKGAHRLACLIIPGEEILRQAKEKQNGS